MEPETLSSPDRSKEEITLSYRTLRLSVPREEAYIYYATYVAKEWSCLKLRKGDYVVDAGANVGDFTLLASDAVGASGLVLAIEPSQRAFDLLKRNVQQSGQKNVVLINAALGSKAGTGILKEQGVGSSLITTPSNYRNRNEDPGIGVPVRVAPLGQILTEADLPRVDVLKMDIEGAESEALVGQHFIDKTREVAIETHSEQLDAQISSILSGAGFQQRTYALSDMMRNTLETAIRDPLDLVQAELATGLLASRGLLSMFARRRPPAPAAERGSGVRIRYGFRTTIPMSL